ncbi:TPA: hypothetical protein O4F24_001456 [Staphylococcus aureus]|nr:hypothetical protein [Staphylococcus aureus]
MENNNYITDLDAIELSSGWNYNEKLNVGKHINVNSHSYKVIDKVNPTSTGLGYKIYERYDNKKPTGRLIISFDGTDFSDINDVNTDLRLAGDSIPNQLLEAGKVYSNLKINIKTQIQWIHLNSNQNTMKILQITKENQSQMQGVIHSLEP